MSVTGRRVLLVVARRKDSSPASLPEPGAPVAGFGVSPEQRRMQGGRDANPQYTSCRLRRPGMNRARSTWALFTRWLAMLAEVGLASRPDCSWCRAQGVSRRHRDRLRGHLHRARSLRRAAKDNPDRCFAPEPEAAPLLRPAKPLHPATGLHHDKRRQERPFAALVAGSRRVGPETSRQSLNCHTILVADPAASRQSAR